MGINLQLISKSFNLEEDIPLQRFQETTTQNLKELETLNKEFGKTPEEIQNIQTQRLQVLYEQSGKNIQELLTEITSGHRNALEQVLKTNLAGRNNLKTEILETSIPEINPAAHEAAKQICIEAQELLDEIFNTFQQIAQELSLPFLVKKINLPKNLQQNFQLNFD